MSESQLMNAIIEELQYRRLFLWRNNNTPTFDATRQIYRSMPKFSLPGVSDITGVLPDGRAFFIEVKTPSGRLSMAQKNFMARVNQTGGLAIVARNSQDVYMQLAKSGYPEFKKYVDGQRD